LRSKKLRKEVKEKPFLFGLKPHLSLNFKVQKNKKSRKESLGLGKKSYGTETDSET
jgi:hypothetical protein